MKEKFAINGRFLTQKITGVQRFEREIVRSMDLIVAPGEVCILVPKEYDKSYILENIQIIVIGKTKGILWEQKDFCMYLIKHHLTGINLGNVAPLIKPDIVCIHDVKLVRNPKWFSWRYVIWSKINYHNALMRGKLVLTVSNFSKTEIKTIYPNAKVDIAVIDEGWQHMIRIREDLETLKKYGVEKDKYFFSLYQSIPNKNFEWILKAADKNKKDVFVVSGWNYKKTNISDINESDLLCRENIKVLGYISDEEMKCLITNCKAFIFPSLYEGFGLPPLEALSLGTKVMVMDIPVMRENFGDSVQYISNENHEIVIDTTIKGEDALKRHSWDNGANIIMDKIHLISKD